MMGSQLEFLIKDKAFAICWLKMNQSCDFMPMYEKMEEGTRKKVNALIFRTARNGPGPNKQKWRILKTGLFEMKSGQYRIPFFYHKSIPKLIVITHIFKKKQEKCPRGELRELLKDK